MYKKSQQSRAAPKDRSFLCKLHVLLKSDSPTDLKVYVVWVGEPDKFYSAPRIAEWWKKIAQWECARTASTNSLEVTQWT